MANPKYGNDRLVMLLAGDDAAAKKSVAELSNALGFETVDAGELQAARHLESLAMLWIHLALKRGLGPNFGFKLARR
jgi:predicted dinucleotide-binding enzyme